MSTVLQSSPLPSRAALRSLVEDLVGRTVDLFDADPVSTAPSNLVAVYVTDQLTMTAVTVVDFAGAARIGGALGGDHPEEALRKGSIAIFSNSGFGTPSSGSPVVIRLA